MVPEPCQINLENAKKRSRNPPTTEKLNADLEARRRPRKLPPQIAIRPIRKVRTAVSGRGKSREAAPMPAAALSAERANPRERASVGDKMSMSSQFASLIVFLRELSKIFTKARTNKIAKEKKEVAGGGICALKRFPKKREEMRSKSDRAATITAEKGGIFTLSAPYAKPAVNASAERAIISSINFEMDKNKRCHLPLLFAL